MIRSLFANPRARLVLLGVLALFPAFGLMLYADSVQRLFAMPGVQDNVLRLARLAASNQLRAIDTARRLFAALARVPEAHNRIFLEPAARLGLVALAMVAAWFARNPSAARRLDAFPATAEQISVGNLRARLGLSYHVRKSSKLPRGEVLERFASAQDISHLRRIEETEREERVLAEALRDTAAALNSTLDFGEVLNRILDNVGRVVPHDAADIMLVESDVARPVGCRGYAERGVETWLLAQRFPLARFSRMRRMMETGQSVLVEDVRADPTWVDLPETRWIRSLIGMPIRVKERVVGFLNIISTAPGFFDATHLARIEAFADQVAIALENARLLAETELRRTADWPPKTSSCGKSWNTTPCSPISRRCPPWRLNRGRISIPVYGSS